MEPLGPGHEFDRLRGVFARLAATDTLGDDCALVTVGGAHLAVSCDVSVEGRHFRRAWLSPSEIGWRSAAAALSDLAAVAAAPAGVLAAVVLPDDLPSPFLEEAMAGVEGAAHSVGAALWGGDLSAGDLVTIDVTVIGQANRPMRRAGAKAGDGVWVTGAFGGAAAAVRAWESGASPTEAARRRFAHPEPRVAWGAWLRDHGATAMLDVSDGLAGDAGHLAAASGVRLVLDADAVPRAEGVRDWEEAVRGGEDYELLVTLPAGFDAAPAWLTPIGTVEAGEGVVWRHEGQEVQVGPGFSHF